jgi:hypothetical protein
MKKFCSMSSCLKNLCFFSQSKLSNSKRIWISVVNSIRKTRHQYLVLNVIYNWTWTANLLVSKSENQRSSRWSMHWWRFRQWRSEILSSNLNSNKLNCRRDLMLRLLKEINIMWRWWLNRRNHKSWERCSLKKLCYVYKLSWKRLLKKRDE